jgi:hypothetical protein
MKYFFRAIASLLLGFSILGVMVAVSAGAPWSLGIAFAGVITSGLVWLAMYIRRDTGTP